METGRTGLNHPGRMESFGHRMLFRGSGQVENKRTRTETPPTQVSVCQNISSYFLYPFSLSQHPEGPAVPSTSAALEKGARILGPSR